jgi:hypothetical protein
LQTAGAAQSSTDAHAERHVPLALHRNGAQSIFVPSSLLTVWSLQVSPDKHLPVAVMHTAPCAQSASVEQVDLHSVSAQANGAHGWSCTGGHWPMSLQTAARVAEPFEQAADRHGLATAK